MCAKPTSSSIASGLLLAICILFLFATGAAATDSNNHLKDAAAAKAVATDAYGNFPALFFYYTGAD
jgi:hypothetical protein